MTINCIDEMNLYFHMQNHYKKLRTAKSKINNITQTFQNMPSARSEKLLQSYTCNERHEKICPLLNQNRKKQSRIKSKSEPCMIEVSMKNKIQNKKENSQIPVELQFMKKKENKQKKFPKSAHKNKVNQENIVPKIDILYNGNDNEEKSNSSTNENENSDSCKFSNRTLEDVDEMLNEEQLIEKETRSARYVRSERHEYLQFLLRITEDIIMNNYCKTEDIEKVFGHHIEINKECLNMEKMIAQIESLSSSLNISSDKYKTKTEYTEKYISEPFTESYYYSDVHDCDECSVKRFLSMPNSSTAREFFINAEDNLGDNQSDNVPHNHGFSSCIELKEGNLKYPSEVEVAKSAEVNIFETIGLIKDNEEVLLDNEVLEEISITGSSVTPVESACLEVTTSNEVAAGELKPDIDLTISKISKECTGNVSLNSDDKANKTLQRDRTFVKSNSTSQPKEGPTESSSSIKQNNVNCEEKSTQVLIECKNEECDTTTDNLNQVVDVDSEYVLINGPLYILKEALSPERRIVISEHKHVDIDIAPVKEQSPLDNDLDLSDYALLSQTDSSLQCGLNFSRLLNSDYDLTPEKEECPNKYHYLMVDAYTTISNANIKDQNSKNDLLVRSETYLNKSEEALVTNEEKDVFQNLLTKSEEYLLQSMDVSFGSSMNARIISHNFIDYQENDESTSVQIESSGEVQSSQSNTLEKYKIKGEIHGNSITESYELRRQKSLQ